MRLQLQLQFLVSVLPFISLHVNACSASDTQRAFEAANIPSDLNITFINPSANLEVSFGVKDSVSLRPAGTTVLQNQTAPLPSFGLKGRYTGNLKGPFVIAVVDPDAPMPQNRTLGPIRHLVAPNYYNVAGRLRNDTPAISDWVQPAPPPGSDPHRYVFLLFNQSPDFESKATALINGTQITNFDLSKFAEETGLGDPLAGNFMMVGPGQQA